MRLLSLSGRSRNVIASYLFLAGMLLSALVFAGAALRTEQQAASAAAELSRSVLRFHVRADADTEEAQELKLRVRDTILAYVQPLLSNVGNRDEAEQILAGRLPQIEAAAEAVTARYGCGESVHAELTKDFFPVRTYGSVLFPAGLYHSLTVTVGSGKGHNWWCVMYPTLCFQNSDSTDISEESEERLTNLLSPDANEILTGHGGQENTETVKNAPHESTETNEKAAPTPRFRFRFLTFLNRYLPD